MPSTARRALGCRLTMAGTVRGEPAAHVLHLNHRRGTTSVVDGMPEAGERQAIGKGSNSLYALLGGVVGAASLISLLQKISGVELAPVLAECMAYGQQIIGFFTEPIMTVLARVLPFALPEWYRDLWVISFVLTSLNLQAALIEVGEGDTVPGPVRIFLNIFFGLCILGLAALNAFILLGLAIPFLALRDLGNKNDAATAKTCLASVALAALATIAFFALNSQLQDTAVASP